MREALDRWGQQFKHRISMMIGRAVLSLVDDTGDVQLVQIKMLDGEVSDQVEHRQPYGFTSNTKPSGTTEGLLLAVGGQRGAGVVILLGDPASRLTGLQPGEVAMHDDQAQKIVIMRDRILITTTKDIDVDCKDLTLTATGDVTATISGDCMAAVSGDFTATVTGTAKITGGTTQILGGHVDLGATGGKAVARVGDSVAGGKITSGSATVNSA